MQAPAFAIHLRKLHPAFPRPADRAETGAGPGSGRGFVPCLTVAQKPVHFQAGEVFAFYPAGFSGLNG